MNTLGMVTNLVAAAVLSLSFIEALVLRFLLKRPYDWRAPLASLALLPIGRFIGDLVPMVIAMPGASWLYERRIFSPEQHGIWYYLLLFVSTEFAYYWWHRLSHRCRWLWVQHAVHHSTNHFNLSAAYRLGVTGKVMGGFVIFSPLSWLGFDPQMIFVAYFLNFAYQSWIHTEWIPRLGILEGILNSPAAHRVHHAANLEYLDANYGGVLMVFDRLFGTYRAEIPGVAIRYGLVVPLQTNNPLYIAFHQFGPLLRDLRRARSLRDIVGYLFRPPGWQPNGRGTTTEELRARTAAVYRTRNFLLPSVEASPAIIATRARPEPVERVGT